MLIGCEQGREWGSRQSFQARIHVISDDPRSLSQTMFRNDDDDVDIAAFLGSTLMTNYHFHLSVTRGHTNSC